MVGSVQVDRDVGARMEAEQRVFGATQRLVI